MSASAGCGRSFIVNEGSIVVQQEVDWESLARRLGSLSDNSEVGGTYFAQVAIAELLGPELLRSAVDYYVDRPPGSELARSVLALLRPSSAIERCYEIYVQDQDIDRRRAAVELLGAIGTGRALEWVNEFWRDSDPGIQNWGANLLDQLLFSYQVEIDAALPLLREGINHPNPNVRETISSIQRYMRDRMM